MKKTYLFITFILLIISCDKDDNIELKDSQQAVDKIEIKNGKRNFIFF